MRGLAQKSVDDKPTDLPDKEERRGPTESKSDSLKRELAQAHSGKRPTFPNKRDPHHKDEIEPDCDLGEHPRARRTELLREVTGCSLHRDRVERVR